MFISSYNYYLFFRKKIIFLNVYIFSEYDIRISLYVFWLRMGSSIKYVRNWWGMGVIQNAYSFLQGEGRECHASCVRTHLDYLFSYFWQHFCLVVSCFICRNLALPLFKKDVFVRNGNCFPTRSISVVFFT